MYIKITVFFIVIASLFSCNQGEDFQYLEGNALGTTFSITYKNPNNYSQSIDSLFNVINNSLSTYHTNSIISKINRGDSSIVVDKHFVKVYSKAKRIYKETDNYFDPTVGLLVNAWGFGPEKKQKALDSTAVIELMNYVGFDKISLEDNKILKQFPEMFIDFNAIAKGYMVDVIGVFLESKHIDNYMVEIGGEIRVRGVNSKGNLWKIGVEKPQTEAKRINATTVLLADKSMATSGNYRKFSIDEQGNKFVHTINPKTGFTEQNNLLSATVISSKDCADVDAYATAFMAMGYRKTKLFLEKHQELQAVLIYVDSHGETRVEILLE